MVRSYSRRIREPRPVGDGICELDLSSGFVGLIDEADAERVAVCNWCVSFNGKDNIPTVKGRPIPGSSRFVRLHCFILCFPLLQVDHRNRLRTDNRRSNLRLVTQSQNMANIGLRSDSSTGLKGVSRSGCKFTATLRGNLLGAFNTPEEAASAYDRMAVELHGEFAATNASLGLLEAAS